MTEQTREAQQETKVPMSAGAEVALHDTPGVLDGLNLLGLGDDDEKSRSVTALFKGPAQVRMKFVRMAAVVSIGTMVLLAGCSSSSSPNETAPSSTSAATTTAPKPTTQAAPNEAMMSQYKAWSDKFNTVVTAFADDTATSSFTKAAGHVKELAALAVAGKKLPPTGNAKADAEWQGAMADLSAFAVLAEQGLRTRDPDKLMDSLDLLSNVGDHVTAWARAELG